MYIWKDDPGRRDGKNFRNQSTGVWMRKVPCTGSFRPRSLGRTEHGYDDRACRGFFANSGLWSNDSPRSCGGRQGRILWKGIKKGRS